MRVVRSFAYIHLTVIFPVAETILWPFCTSRSIRLTKHAFRRSSRPGPPKAARSTISARFTATPMPTTRNFWPTRRPSPTLRAVTLCCMDATNGIPTATTPLTVPVDPEILRLEQVARGGLQPRIANIAFHTVPIRAGGNVLIVRVPRSYNPPHRIIRQGSNRFWARSAAGKYEPDVSELRTSKLMRAALAVVDPIGTNDP